VAGFAARKISIIDFRKWKYLVKQVHELHFTTNQDLHTLLFELHTKFTLLKYLTFKNTQRRIISCISKKVKLF